MVLLLVLTIHLLLLANTKFTLWPEMVVYPYLLNHGFTLYKDIINPYQPIFLLFLTYFSKVFGYDPVLFKIFTWLIILIIDLCIYKITKDIFGKHKALFSVAFFVIFSIPFAINGLWFDLVQTPFVLFSIYYALKFFKKPTNLSNFFLSQIFLIIAFFIKQQVIWLDFFYLMYLCLKLPRKKLIKPLSLIILTPLILLVFETFVFRQVLPDFFFWTVYFPFFKASQMPGYILLPTIRQMIIVFSIVILFLPSFFKKDLKLKFISICCLISVLFAYPRFDYFHLTPTLAIASLLISSNFPLPIKSSNFTKYAYLISAIILILFTARYLKSNWTSEVRFFEGNIYASSTFLKIITNKNEPIYIQNGPDQILPLAERLPTKPWADDFPWYLEISSIQDKVLNGLKEQNPRFIIVKPYDQGEKFALGSYRPVKIAEYIEKNYRNVMQISDTLWLKEKI